MRKIFLSWMLILLIFLPQLLYSQVDSHLYSTGSAMEPDRCASAWLIKRFVDQDAHFKFFPDGQLIPEGIPFDTPDAALSRTHNLATFEIIVHKYKINDSGIKQLSRIFHSIEVNYWSGEKSALTMKVEQDLKNIINQSADNAQCLESCNRYLDNILVRLKEMKSDD